MNSFNFLICLLLSSITFFICAKKKFLVDQKVTKHKQFVKQERENYLIGGFFLIIFFSFLYLENNFILILPITLLFLLGLGSDTKTLENPNIRFVIQILIILLFIHLSNIKIVDTRLAYINQLLAIDLLSIIFTVFCIMVFINGINFIDGINTIVLTYIIFIILSIISLDFFQAINIEERNLKFLLIYLLIIFFLNYFGLVFLGDSGSYLISLFVSAELIYIVNQNSVISPYLVILLLIYPCFEILFTMLRRYKFKKNILLPDNRHLHHLLYRYFKKKFFINEKNYHLITSLSINFTLLVFFFIGIFFYNESKILLILIFLKIFFYLIIYKCLSRHFS